MNPMTYEKLHTNLLKLDMTYLETRIDGLLEDFSTSKTSLVEVVNNLMEEELQQRVSRSVKTRIKLAWRTVDKR